MHDKPIEPMTAENMEEFNVLICNPRDLVVSVIPIYDPRHARAEKYEVDQPAQ